MRTNSKYSSRTAISILTGTVFILFFAGCKSGEKEAEVVVTVQAATAQNADISRTVTADAAIFPVAQSLITPKINAPVRTFYVNRGQKVHQGQLLAVLENKDLAAAALDNKGSFEQAQATYATNVGATLPEDVQKAELETKSTKEALDAQQKLYDSRETLFNEGALPRKDLDQARVALVQGKSAYEQARKHLDYLNVLVKAQTLKSASGQLTSAQGKYYGAQAQLSYSEIRSPINGVVTDRPLYPGEMASTTSPLITIMDVSGIIAKAHIPQSDAQLLHKGDAAKIQVPGIDPVDGKVTIVSPALDPNSTTVEVWVQAKNPNQQLRPGTTARISITAQTVHDALVVPVPALLNASGDTAQVMVINAEGKAVSRDVKTGIQTPEQAQIVSGLKPGEQVVTTGAYGLPDKTKVKIEKPAPAGEGDAGKDKDKDKDKD